MNEGDQNSMHAMEILITGEKRDEKEKILTHHEKENQSSIQTKELTSSSTKFKEVRIINTLPISQFNQVISDKSGNYPRSPLLYVSSNNTLVKYTLSIPNSIYACSKLRDMFYDNFATQNIKLITDKIKETDFNRIKYSAELLDNASSSKVEIAELESNSGGVKSSDKDLKISIDKKTDISNVKECNSEASKVGSIL